MFLLHFTILVGLILNNLLVSIILKPFYFLILSTFFLKSIENVMMLHHNIFILLRPYSRKKLNRKKNLIIRETLTEWLNKQNNKTWTKSVVKFQSIKKWNDVENDT
jgi:hypothetical protein